MAEPGKAVKPFPLPPVPATDDFEVWRLGAKSRRNVLNRTIGPFSPGLFWVTSPAHEKTLTELRRRFDASRGRDRHGLGLLHNMVGLRGVDENDDVGVAAFEAVLALGLDPDPENTAGWRPSHACGLWGRVRCARALGACRPDLGARTKEGRTPLEAARAGYPNQHDPENDPEPERAKRRPAVANVWIDLERDGFPSLAELAANKQWWAIMNLCRRRVWLKKDLSSTHEGRNVVEWAHFHQEFGLADELMYFLGPLLLPSPGPPSVPNEEGHKGAGDLNEAVALLHSKFEEEMVETKKELDELKKALEEGEQTLGTLLENQKTDSERDRKIRELETAVEKLGKKLAKVEQKAEQGQAEGATSSGTVAASKLKMLDGCLQMVKETAIASGSVGMNRIVADLLALLQKYERS